MKNFFSIGFLFVVLVITGNALFVVKETERAVMLQFGQLVNADIAPGLHVKVPWVNTVRKFDARIQTEDTTPERFLTLEQKALEVDSYAKWRIIDVGQFYIGSVDTWKKNKDILGKKTICSILPLWRCQDIDYLYQWEKAKKIYDKIIK